MRKTLLLTLLVSGSLMHQKTIVFDEPIDALSVRLPHNDTNVSVLLEDGWHDFFIEKEFDPTLMESDLVMLPKGTTEVVLRGQIDHIELHPISIADEPASYALAARQFYRAPKILSRLQWGADEGFLFAGPPVERSDVPKSTGSTSSTSSASSKRQDDCTLAQKNHPHDFKTTKTVTHSADGKRYRWPKRYSNNVKLLVVHHTAQKMAGDTRTGVEKMRALYEYHTNSRGWGDIGYHYIIDDTGVIYEGRSGGDKVVGGHVYCGNVGTIGVALMGNFDVEQPTQSQMQALQWLLDDLGDRYSMNLNRNAVYHGKNKPSIVGHKDLISTECPGYYMSPAVAQVRRNVIAGNLNATVTFPKVIAKGHTDRTTTRLTKRLQEAGQSLSRRFYRTKRQIRTAERKGSTRMDYLQNQLAASTNLQRKRSPTQKPMRPIRGLQSASPNRQFYSQSDLQPNEGHIRIKLSFSGNNTGISSDRSLSVNGQQVGSVRLGRDGNDCVAVMDGRSTQSQVIRIDGGGGVLAIDGWRTRYNRFRGVLECRVEDGRIILINELPLEDYMRGISEQPDTEPREKQKAFAIAARSYAAFYMQPGKQKFAGRPYHGSDTGVSFQNYSGVTAEEDYPKWVQSVIDTRDRVITKDGQIVKAAYFSSSDGRTRSPEDNGWKNFPFAEVFKSKPDPWCEGMKLHGHGVGMSGCGAEGQALRGKKAEEILEYYYPETVISAR